MRRLLFVLTLAASVALPSGGAPAASTPVSVFPIPGSFSTLPQTQIVFRGISPSQIGSIKVVGSKSGTHFGRIAGDSDGHGGSFLPNRPFTAGETVTVSTGLNVLGGSHGSFQFKIISPYAPYKPLMLPYVSPGSGGVQHFKTRSDLQPASVTVTKNSAPRRLGDFFVTPQYGPLQNGPMILDAAGRLIWFNPLPRNMLASDLRVQKLHGAPVLTWWQGVTNNGYGRGQGMIVDQRYHQVAVVNAADGLPGMDLHEFLVTQQGQAYIIGYSPVHWPHMGRPMMDCVIQEIDIKTGLVMFEWHALDHVPLGETFEKGHVPGYVYDPFHMNSIAIDRDGNLIVSMRNTWAAYKIDHQSGAVIWTLGSSRSSFRLGRGAGTAFQHDLAVRPNGTFTMFDDGGGPPYPHPQSRAIQVSVNLRKHRASLLKQDFHSPPLSANFEGSAQILSNGDMFVGWGQQPYFSEFNRSGRLNFDAHFTQPTSSYRAYRFQWNAQPGTLPSVAVGGGPHGTTYVYGSWNGATTVAVWRALGGATSNSLQPLRRLSRTGFETRIPLVTHDTYFAVQALSASGQVLATSNAIHR